MQNLLTGKNVLATGGGRNVDRSICLEAAKQGANIFVADIDKNRLEILKQEMREYPVRTKEFLCDITNFDEIDLSGYE